MCKEELLAGGSENQVIKIGDTVQRQPKAGPMLHAYLQYLEKAGMAGVPRFLGLDESGREILTYLPGKTQENGIPLGHPLLMSEEMIIGVAQFMRKLHDVSVGFLSEALEHHWINPYYPHENCETICHNDAAVWNFVFTDERVTGLIDFDQACAGTRIWDVAWSVYGTVHLQPWVYNPEFGTSEVYNALKHATDRKHRVRLYFDAYGMPCPPDFMDTVYRRIQIGVCDALTRDAAAGDETAIKQVKNGALAHYQRVAACIKECGRDW